VALGDAPPWTRKFLADNWDTIRQGSMPGGEWMPVEGPGSTPKRRLVDALGCGHYGCVFSTNTPGLVIKISSDASEAEFVKAAVKLGEWPVGIVRYQAVLDLPGSHRGRPVFIIWREEAFDIGTIRSTGDRGAEREFVLYHEAYLNAARFIRGLSIKPGFDVRLAEAKAQEQWAWNEVIWEDGGDRMIGPSHQRSRKPGFMSMAPRYRLAAALRICAICFELMENTNHASEVGGALGFYLNEGILLADVHSQNIGQVTRTDSDYGPQTYTVITDPGHAVFLR
jgi:hypothetical protein